jgi:amino acid permease
MGGDQGLTIPQPWLILSNVGFVAVLAFAACAAWLWWQCSARSNGETIFRVALARKTDFFKLFSRISIFIICLTVASAYMAHSEELMDQVFERIPNYYILYILLFVAYDTFWEIVAQLLGVDRH